MPAPRIPLTPLCVLLVGPAAPARVAGPLKVFTYDFEIPAAAGRAAGE